MTGHSKIFGVESSTALDDLAAAPQGKKAKLAKGEAEAGEQDAEKHKDKGKKGKKQ